MTARALLNRERDAGRRRTACAPGRSTTAGAAGVRAPEPESRATLEDLVLESWVGLRSDTSIACLWCDGAMEPRWSAGAGVVGGRCRRCGSELA